MFKIILNTKLIINSFNICIKRGAGHSKWQNIRHIKGAKDAERAQLFTKLSRQMRVAVQMGGSIDPSKNLQLEHIIEQAKRANMPVVTIQSVLKSCEADKSQSKSYMLEIKGPGSCFILCEVFSPQLQIIRQNIASILKKHKSKYTEGSAKHMFEEKGLIETEIPEGKKVDEILELATDDAIEAGAEEVKLIEDNTILQFLCGSSNLKAVTNSLESKYNILGASVEFLPVVLHEVQEDDFKLCEKLYDKLNGMSEVVRIVDNIQR